MTDRLKDRVAIVTGGAQSIGAAIADRLAAAGATVVVGDVQETDAHSWHHLDVTSEDSITAIIDDVVSTHGRLDIVVNNAGIMFEKNIIDQDRASWDLMLAVNMTGPMLMSRHAAPHLAAHGVGAIVNISSIEGHCGNPQHVAYSSTKAGVQGMTRATAIDLGPMGIRCNAIAPGWIDTPLNATYVDSHPDRELVIDELAKLHPVGRVGDTSDVGDVAVWLASDESRFVTGQIITVDGGRTLRPTLPPVMGR
ncbi:MAG: SDR family oxidoreductase [Acidimicrobiia bacterium]|nr:SDR family oxidoreductase [Acidimicrobiia bacterium]RZV41433.1 MAG: SDR family oxidoreductase [Acidimicrobiales bacterium]